jgi:hypothetical protein
MTTVEALIQEKGLKDFSKSSRVGSTTFLA